MNERIANTQLSEITWYLARWCQRDLGLGRAPTDAEFDAWLKGKGL